MLQTDWFNSDPGGSAPYMKTSDTLVSGVVPGELWFGNYQNVPVKVFKYLDKNADGHYVAADGDTPIEGWSITASATAGSFKQTLQTGANGEANFSLKPGSYDVYEALNASDGWICSEPGAAGTWA